MFRNRANSQKPTDELYELFKKNFPGVRSATSSTTPPSLPGTSSAAAEPCQASASDSQHSTLKMHVDSDQHFAGHDHMSVLDGLNLFSPHRHDDIHREFDRTPRASTESWRLTPSFLDPTSGTFASLGGHMPSFYAMSPSDSNHMYHHQAGDLHTPRVNYGLNTPLSLPTSDSILQGLPTVPVAELPQTIHAHEFHNFHSYAPQRQFDHEILPQSGFDLSQEMHSLVQPEVQPSKPPPATAFRQDSGVADVSNSTTPTHLSNPGLNYVVTLNAPTAMVKHSDEIPLTYLNKGQAYQLSILNNGTLPTTEHGPVRYRTFIRISFQEQSQRDQPATCWQLWKEGRGLSEAQQRGGKLQAVEFVESLSTVEENMAQPKVELEHASFDGFAVVWSPQSSQHQCSLAVRFNFLSTDFSHSKGVKGIPVRLCAKTELLANDAQTQPPPAEICYCKVKLFRDHGAERKLSNDVAHVKKTMEKLHLQIAQADTGMRDFSKKKRPSFGTKNAPVSKPGKVKHKRTWSMSSGGSSSGNQPSLEDDLHLKLATMKDMFSSTRPYSVLSLPGEAGDDPDHYPVQLPMDSGAGPKLERDSSWDRRNSTFSAPQVPRTAANSRSPSSVSLQSASAHGSMVQLARQYGQEHDDWPMFHQTSNSLQDLTMASHDPNSPVKVARRQHPSRQSSGWIDALDVDPHYQPPPEPVVKPVACFYIQPRFQGHDYDTFYRAIYLYGRNVAELTRAVASKCGVEPTSVTRVVYAKSAAMQVLLDDDFVQVMPEGQDMRIEFIPLDVGPRRREWDTTDPAPLVDGDDPVRTAISKGWELRMMY